MRRTTPIATFLLVAGLAAGCNSMESKSTLAQNEKTRTDMKQAAQSLQDDAYAQKAEYVQKMKNELAAIREEMDRLSDKIDRSNGVAKSEARTALDAMREKWVLAKKRLDQAESASESAWDEAKNGLKESYGDLKVSFDKTRQWLSDKIEP